MNIHFRHFPVLQTSQSNRSRSSFVLLKMLCFQLILLKILTERNSKASLSNLSNRKPGEKNTFLNVGNHFRFDLHVLKFPYSEKKSVKDIVTNKSNTTSYPK